MDQVETPPPGLLQQIDLRTRELHETTHEHGKLLVTLVQRLDRLLDLLTPKDLDPDRVQLDELLAHLIQQNREQLLLARRMVEVVSKLQAELPKEVVAALLASGGDGKGRAG